MGEETELPQYFQKYLDAKFETVNAKIDDVHAELIEFKAEQRNSSMKWGGSIGALAAIGWEMLKSYLGIHFGIKV